MTQTLRRMGERQDWAYKKLLPIISQLPLSAPTFEHCVGLRRFLGGSYPDFLSEWASLSVESLMFECLGHLSMTLRSLLVLDDYCRDSGGGLDQRLDHVLLELRSLASESIEMVVSRDVAVSLLDECERNIEHTYNELAIGTVPSLSTVHGKCDYVHLPAQIIALVDNNFDLQGFRRFLRTYFFSLQLIDDFCDMEEDYNSALNHNLFLWHIEPSLAQQIISNRGALVPYLADCIMTQLLVLRNLSQFKGKKCFYALLDATCLTLGRWSEHLIPLEVNPWHGLSDYGHYRPFALIERHVVGQFLDSAHLLVRPISLEGFRAENVHEIASSAALGDKDLVSSAATLNSR